MALGGFDSSYGNVMMGNMGMTGNMGMMGIMNPMMMSQPFNIISNNNNVFKNNYNTYNYNYKFPPGMNNQYNFDNMNNNIQNYNQFLQGSGNINIQNNYFMCKNQENVNNKNQDNINKKNEKNISNEKQKKKKKRKPKRLETSSFINKPLSYFADNIIICAKDQGASRYLQQLLDNNPKEITDFLFPPLYKNALKLINDPFGNYLLQKIIKPQKYSHILLPMNQIVITIMKKSI